jgi:cubilin
MAEQGYNIRVTFTSFSLGAGDTVKVFDGSSTNATALGTFSGTTLPAAVSSNVNVITVQFRSDGSTQGAGFEAQWSLGCGATYTGVTSGRIVSPGYPGRNYPDNLQCDYLINWNTDQSLALAFSDPFDIEVTANCAYDSLKIWGGVDDSGTVLGNLCGDQVPIDILWLGPVFIRFRSDSSINGAGFGLDFEPGCGGTFTASSGIIQTPDHLETYRHNSNCTWLITVADQRSVSLKFSSMDIELHPSCVYDYLEIFDGDNESAPLLVDRLCGSVPPSDAIISSGNSMLVRFVSDFSVSGEGFQAAYREVIGPALGCGGNLNAAAGNFTSVSLDGSGLYANNLDCAFFITAEINKAVQITFTGTFAVEGSGQGNCPYDFLEIRDGYGSSAPFIDYYCGSSLPGPITFSSNQAYVRFFTDSSVTDQGFTINYASIDPLCGGTFNATDSPQTITSPNYPAAYPHNIRCRWYIGAPLNDHDHVRITVTALDIEDHSDCIYDYLQFSDFPVTNGQQLKYCGSTIPPVFDSVGSTAEIYFLTDTSSSASGFSLQYAIADCSKTYSADNGRVTSPGYPQYYHNLHNCSITISAPSGSYLALYFNNLVLEFHENCQFDYLNIYDGPNDSSPLLISLCGIFIPDPIFLTSNVAFLNFVTDASVTYAGFDLTYTSNTVSSGCGGSLGGRQGSLTSPAHPAEYAGSLDCGWAISVPSGGRALTLEFTTLAVEGVQGVCAQDYVDVYDGTSATDPMIGRYCGLAQPALLTASGRNLYVRFVTDAQNAPNNGTLIGFRAVYNS